MELVISQINSFIPRSFISTLSQFSNYLLSLITLIIISLKSVCDGFKGTGPVANIVGVISLFLDQAVKIIQRLSYPK